MSTVDKSINIDNALYPIKEAVVLCERLNLPRYSAVNNINKYIAKFGQSSFGNADINYVQTDGNVDVPLSVFSLVKPDEPIVKCLRTADNKFEERSIVSVEKRELNVNATSGSLNPNNSLCHIKNVVIRCERLPLLHNVEDSIRKVSEGDKFSVRNIDMKYVKPGGHVNVGFKPPVSVLSLVRQDNPIVNCANKEENKFEPNNTKAVMNDGLYASNTHRIIKTENTLYNLKKAVVRLQRLSLPYNFAENNINKRFPKFSAEKIDIKYFNTSGSVAVDHKSSRKVNDNKPMSTCLMSEKNQVDQKNIVGNLNCRIILKKLSIITTGDKSYGSTFQDVHSKPDKQLVVGMKSEVEVSKTQIIRKPVSTINNDPKDETIHICNAVSESSGRPMQCDFTTQDEESSDDMESVEINTDENTSCAGETISSDVARYASLNINIPEREMAVSRSNLNEGGNIVSCLFQCEHCGREFSKPGSLKYHKTIKHFLVYTFSCEICSKKFLFKSSYVNHMKWHSTKQAFICNYCGLSCKHKCKLIYHIKQVHLKESAIKCNQCSKSFSCKESLKNHMRIHDGLRPFVCSVCGKSFTQKSYLWNHSFIHSKDRRYRCETCGNSFTERGSLKRHLILHTGVKPFRCSECGKSFAVRGNLQKHLKVHNMKKETFHCQHCSKSLTSYTGFKTHVYMHERKKKYHCAECNKTFFSKDNLRLHIYRHTKPYEYICNDCGRVFNCRDHFILHTRIHTGFRPYKCKYCAKSFTQAVALNNHHLIHTGEKELCCEICGEMFRRKHHLDSHKIKHT